MIYFRASRLAVDKICISVCESPEVSNHDHTHDHVHNGINDHVLNGSHDQVHRGHNDLLHRKYVEEHTANGKLVHEHTTIPNGKILALEYRETAFN